MGWGFWLEKQEKAGEIWLKRGKGRERRGGEKEKGKEWVEAGEINGVEEGLGEKRWMGKSWISGGKEDGESGMKQVR